MQFNRGTSAMQHYVATRPMFIDVEIMNADTRLVLGEQGLQATPSNVARGLSSLYKEITGRKVERLTHLGFCSMNLLYLDCVLQIL